MVIFLLKKTYCKLIRKSSLYFMVTLLIVVETRMICFDDLPVCYAKEDDLNLYSKSYAVIDGDNGRVLFEKNGKDSMANASTTKILTCIVALENIDQNTMVTPSKNAINQPRVRLGLKEKTKYRIKDMLYGLMLESFNDCAVVIAEAVSGNVDEFSKLMNSKAKEIGCENTYFITPNGLDKENEDEFHHTTAVDLCRIMKYCCWDSPYSSQFLEITQTTSYNLEGKTFNNHNRLLNKLNKIISGKTGYTSKAGYCYVAAFEGKDGRRLCISLLGCGWPNHSGYKWKDCSKIVDFCNSSYFMKRIGAVSIHKKLEVKNGYKDEFKLSKNRESEYVSINCERLTKKVLIAKNEKVEAVLLLKDKYYAPISRVKSLGTVEYSINNDIIAVGNIYAENDIKLIKFKLFFKQFFLEFF